MNPVDVTREDFDQAETFMRCLDESKIPPTPTTMKLVQQRRKGECGPACLAMVLGIELDQAVVEVEKQTGRPCTTYGCSDSDMTTVLQAHGLRHARRSLDWFMQGEKPEPAILTVPSLNHAGLLHFVVWDGERYLDPSNEAKRYPEDGPEIAGERTVSWASLITWSEP